jgi:hypothetical protein
MLLSKFGNEVLSRGPSAVLPQNLSAEWLRIVQHMADEFLDTNFDGDSCRVNGFSADPILSACVSEIVSYQKDGNVDIREAEMFQKLTLYSLAVTLETVRQDSEIALEPPSLDTIFDIDRLQRLKHQKPEIARILDVLCLNIPESH